MISIYDVSKNREEKCLRTAQVLVDRRCLLLEARSKRITDNETLHVARDSYPELGAMILPHWCEQVRRQVPEKGHIPEREGGAHAHFKQHTSDWPISYVSNPRSPQHHLRAANASALPPPLQACYCVEFYVRYYFLFVRTLVSESWVHDAAFCWAAGANALADAASARMLAAMQVFMVDSSTGYCATIRYTPCLGRRSKSSRPFAPSRLHQHVEPKISDIRKIQCRKCRFFFCPPVRPSTR